LVVVEEVVPTVEEEEVRGGRGVGLSFSSS